MNKVLVVGGAGYIGSHMSKLLALNGVEVTVLDNLSTGFERLAKYGHFVRGDLSDVKFLNQFFSQNAFDAVMHFGASSLVAESVNNPSKYYRNNVVNTLNLLDVMIESGVDKLIFSSTAAIFGNPKYVPIDENHPTCPINPYGVSKLVVENVLKDYSAAYGLSFVSLRYFNACGADTDGELGELHDPETHLIPIVLQAASGRRDSITIFGNDYDTNDGTCVRDYIHVEDLVNAHYLAFQKMMSNEIQGPNFFNLGNGVGYSVREVIDAAAARVSKEGLSIEIRCADRRAGDPGVLIASSEQAESILGWVPIFNSIDDIISHAWEWEKKQLKS
jgi:UDP-glucose 4-epimerase